MKLPFLFFKIIQYQQFHMVQPSNNFVLVYTNYPFKNKM